MNAIATDWMGHLSSKILVNFPQLDGQLEVLDGCVQPLPMLKVTHFLDDENDAGFFPGEKAIIECWSNGLPHLGANWNATTWLDVMQSAVPPSAILTSVAPR